MCAGYALCVSVRSLLLNVSSKQEGPVITNMLTFKFGSRLVSEFVSNFRFHCIDNVGGLDLEADFLSLYNFNEDPHVFAMVRSSMSAWCLATCVKVSGNMFSNVG